MGKHLVLVGGGHAHMVTLANLHQFIEKGHKVTVTGPSAHHYYSGMGPGMLGKTYSPDQIRFATQHVVEKQGGTFILGLTTHIDPQEKVVFLESGERHSLDFIFVALGVKPSPIFKNSGLPIGSDGGMEVNSYLQSTAHPEIFGGGDCIYFNDRPLDKVGVYAVCENAILFHNLMSSLGGAELQPFDPGGNYPLIFNMAGGSGILHKSGLT